jgi:HK97 family phage major capsid protein
VSTTTATTLIQSEVANVLVQPLEAASVFLQMSPRIFDSAVPLRIPTLEGSTGADYVNELDTIPEDDADFDEVELLPTARPSVKVICKISNEARRQSAISLDQIVRDRLVQDVASKIDTEFLNGTGTDNHMTGLFVRTGTTAVDADPGTLDGILAGQAALLAAEVPANNLRVLVNPATYSKLIGEKASGTGNYQLQPDATRAAGLQVFGMPLFVSSKVPAGKAAILDPSFVAVGRDSAPQVTLLDQTYADQDALGIRVTARFDIAFLRPAAVAIIQDVA